MHQPVADAQCSRRTRSWTCGILREHRAARPPCGRRGPSRERGIRSVAGGCRGAQLESHQGRRFEPGRRHVAAVPHVSHREPFQTAKLLGQRFTTGTDAASAARPAPPDPRCAARWRARGATARAPCRPAFRRAPAAAPLGHSRPPAGRLLGINSRDMQVHAHSVRAPPADCGTRGPTL